MKNDTSLPVFLFSYPYSDLCERFRIGRHGGRLMAILAVGTVAGTLNGADVPGGTNLAPLINDATPTTNEFNLLGDVTMGAIGYQNVANRRVIFIEGNGHTITKTANANIFWITGGLTNAFLTIRNANITSVNSGSSYGTISVDVNANNATIDLDGTRIYGTHGIDGAYSGALTTHAKNTLVLGNVEFDANYGTGNAAGAVGVGVNASMAFDGKTTFTNNYTAYYGGAVSVYDGGELTFRDDALFSCPV